MRGGRCRGAVVCYRILGAGTGTHRWRDGAPGPLARRGLVPSNGPRQPVLEVHSRFDIGSSTPSVALVPVLRSSIVEENDEIGTATPGLDRPGAGGDGSVTLSIATGVEVIGRGRRLRQINDPSRLTTPTRFVLRCIGCLPQMAMNLVIGRGKRRAGSKRPNSIERAGVCRPSPGIKQAAQYASLLRSPAFGSPSLERDHLVRRKSNADTRAGRPERHGFGSGHAQKHAS